MAQSYRANSIWHNDIIITWHSLLVLFVSAANEFAAQNSNTWLVLAVAVRFRNPPPSPAPPVYPFVWWFIHVCYIWWLFRICYMCSSISYLLTAAFCGCIGRSKTRYLLCHSSSSVADLFHQTPKGKTFGYIIMPIPPRVVLIEILFLLYIWSSKWNLVKYKTFLSKTLKYLLTSNFCFPNSKPEVQKVEPK